MVGVVVVAAAIELANGIESSATAAAAAARREIA